MADIAICTAAVPDVLAGKPTVPDPPLVVVNDAETGPEGLTWLDAAPGGEAVGDALGSGVTIAAGTLLGEFVPPQPAAASTPLQARQTKASRPNDRAWGKVLS
ncbi:MAG TPA: hypothetical protein VMA36_11225 [Candidatus Limnocylindria bacterium]|nr:hypothetical protein [Candidatus Limnocylindria bacterium]